MEMYLLSKKIKQISLSHARLWPIPKTSAILKDLQTGKEESRCNQPISCKQSDGKRFRDMFYTRTLWRH